MAGRMLRFLAARDIIDEPSKDHFATSTLSEVLATPIGEKTLKYAFETAIPPAIALPEFLERNKYQGIDSLTNTPFQLAFKTELPAFQWMATQPERMANFQALMTSAQSSVWMDHLKPLQNAIAQTPQETDKERVFFVDVGGGYGHQAIQLVTNRPALKGQVMLQDLPTVGTQLEASKPHPRDLGVEFLAQNFFEPQAVKGMSSFNHHTNDPNAFPSTQPTTLTLRSKGAKFYYLRMILHDYPDAECRTILANLARAMAPDSRILIDEVCLPDVGAHWRACSMDLAMMILLAGRERTMSDWKGLIESVRFDAGDGEEKGTLEIEAVEEYNRTTHKCVLILKLK
jgi:demethylsterigmatocystin 6-O-methyltransferase